MTEQGRFWCFTLNNYTTDEQSEFEVSHENVSYIIYGEEVGENGTPHLQGYIEFVKNTRISAIKKLFKNNRMHLEKRIGTSQQASDYCRKEGKVYERGVLSVSRVKKDPSSKNKLLPYVELIKKEGLSALSNDADCTLHLLKHGQLWLSLNSTPRQLTDPLTVHWYHGETGCGKTYKAYMKAKEAGCEPYIRSGSGRFFDGYEGQKFVIFDDLREHDIAFNFLLRLTDVYPMRVEIKGGTTQWKPHFIFITSPYTPEETFKEQCVYGAKDSINQLLRRIHVIEKVEKTEAPQPPKGGVKRRNDGTEDYSPNTFNYLLPVRRFSGLPPLPRSPMTLRDCQSPDPTPRSQTQEWVPPPGCD